MEDGMIELLQKIRWSTTYLAIGGTVVVMFLLVFAQSLFGAKTTHSQLDRLLGQIEQMNRQLERIGRHLEQAGGEPGGGEKGDSPGESEAEGE